MLFRYWVTQNWTLYQGEYKRDKVFYYSTGTKILLFYDSNSRQQMIVIRSEQRCMHIVIA